MTEPLPARRGRLADLATVGGYRAAAVLARGVPAVVADAAAIPIGFGARTVSTDKRKMVERHLRRVNPQWTPRQVRRAAQQAFESYARYYVESFRLPTLSARAVAAGFDVDGYQHIEGALAGGNGVILALPHLGGWEWAGRWMCDRGHRLTVVVERIEPPALFDWFRRLRRELGMNVVPLGPGAGGEILAALKRNEVVCLLSDRDIGGGGVAVDFFGERTTLPAGPATLGLRTGAPVLPTAVYFTERTDGHLGLVRPPLPADRRGKLRDDVTRITQLLADELELLIRRHPEQWHLLQPNWPSDHGHRA